MAIYYNQIRLNKLHFDEDEKYFTISNENNTVSFNIPYIPKLGIEKYDSNDFFLFLFENNELDAENDVFQLYDKQKNDRIGWIFPVNILVSNDNDYANNKHLNKYKFVAYQILLSKSFLIEPKIDDIKKEEINISDIYGEDTVICILSKKKIDKNNFQITSYYPSLAVYGYFEKNENNISVDYPVKYLIDKFRGKKRLYIESTNNQIYSIDFIKKFYNNYLKTLNHHLIRFHLLYQVIEYLITDNFSKEFETLLGKYNKDEITKNNFIEKINSIRNERKNIRIIFDNLPFKEGTFEKEVKIDLKRDIKDFLREFDNEGKENIGDLIYDTRNIIVHNYRDIQDNELILLDKIIYEFELLIHHLIINSP